MLKNSSFKLKKVEEFIEVKIDSDSSSVNAISERVLLDLNEVTEYIRDNDFKGVILTSGKEVFSAGADIKNFQALFEKGSYEVEKYISFAHRIYNEFEQLPIPKVAVINGFAAGGGAELSLLADYRLMTSTSTVSFPEVKLGILPAFGGLSRLPRVLGLDTAIEWATTGKQYSAKTALKNRFADGVVGEDQVEKNNAAVEVLRDCCNGKLNWKDRYNEKQIPLTLNDFEKQLSFNVARRTVNRLYGKNYPAAQIILDTLQSSSSSALEEALYNEILGIQRCIDSDVPDALISVFLSDQKVKNISKEYINSVSDIERVSVIGAGVMGGGIAYASADRNVDVHLKDINQNGLNIGLNEAATLFSRQVSKGRKSVEEMAIALNRIQPTLHSVALNDSNLVIEAVIEKESVKKTVLKDLETSCPEAVITSNTSTIQISKLAEALERPDNFCGLHFFNPVDRMPLVEVIKGNLTSDETVSKAVNFVRQIGKTPLVVQDCPGFFVNRCLIPYLLAFNELVLEGVSISDIDFAMQKVYGWPMGPSYLLDAIGLDTAKHCIDVLVNAYPDRMQIPEINLVEELLELGRLGKKNGKGFYNYELDRRGRLVPKESEAITSILNKVKANSTKISPDEIIDRLMLPMMLEAHRCLKENVINSAEEGDIAFIYGTGFPSFRGGVFYEMNKLGRIDFIHKCEKYQSRSALYNLPEDLVSHSKSVG